MLQGPWVLNACGYQSQAPDPMIPTDVLQRCWSHSGGWAVSAMASMGGREDAARSQLEKDGLEVLDDLSRWGKAFRSALDRAEEGTTGMLWSRRDDRQEASALRLAFSSLGCKIMLSMSFLFLLSPRHCSDKMFIQDSDLFPPNQTHSSSQGI